MSVMITLCHLPTVFIPVLCLFFIKVPISIWHINHWEESSERAEIWVCCGRSIRDSAWNRVGDQYVSVKRINDTLRSLLPPWQGDWLLVSIWWFFYPSGPAPSKRKFCSDGNILYLHCPITSHADTWSVADATEELNFKFYFILINLHLNVARNNRIRWCCSRLFFLCIYICTLFIGCFVFLCFIYIFISVYTSASWFYFFTEEYILEILLYQAR